MELSPAELGILLATTVVGGVVQGSIGIGFGFILAPVLSIIEPEAVPATILLLAVPLTILMAVRERGAIDGRGFLLIMAGRVPGTALGVLLVVVVTGDALAVLVGAVILISVALTAGDRPIPVTTATTVSAGVVSGVMATATAVGGPPLALLYQQRGGPVLRSTLAMTFGVGLWISLLGLGLAGKIAFWQLRWALLLVPAMLIGLALSGLVVRRPEARWFRPAVLGFAAVAGLAAIVRGLF